MFAFCSAVMYTVPNNGYRHMDGTITDNQPVL